MTDVVLVTGAASGIGPASLGSLLERRSGTRVAMVDRDVEHCRRRPPRSATGERPPL
jgi:NADP-dependent 3-hydroxy acid dehydrogenase YdfG